MTILSGIKPSKKIAWFDIEGVLMRESILHYLLRQRPYLVAGGLLKGFIEAGHREIQDVRRDFREEWTMEFKIYYGSRMSSQEKYSLGKSIFESQSEGQKKTLFDLLEVVNRDGSCPVKELKFRV